MPDAQPTPIVYEQPLSERIRAFLRLEFLFARAEHLLGFSDPWSSRAALEVIIDILALISRSDLKKELIKELERHAATLDGLRGNRKVDQARLAKVLDQVRGTLTTLRTSDQVFGQELRSDELLSAVRQRSSIPAGTCDFDLPAYHFWLQRSAGQRRHDLERWLSTFALLREAVSTCLHLVRQSATATRELAQGGFFQRNLETAPPCQMIRVSMPANAPCYPEISAGKHRFTVRFMRPGDGATRPFQTDEDVSFDLLCCVI